MGSLHCSNLLAFSMADRKDEELIIQHQGSIGDEPSPVITERRDAHGYYWRYDHPSGEPGDTLDAAICIAVEVAADEARRARKTHYVTSRPMPTAVYILPCDHPELSATAMSVMFELSPKGKVIRRPKPTRH